MHHNWLPMTGIWAFPRQECVFGNAEAIVNESSLCVPRQLCCSVAYESYPRASPRSITLLEASIFETSSAHGTHISLPVFRIGWPVSYAAGFECAENSCVIKPWDQTVCIFVGTDLSPVDYRPCFYHQVSQLHTFYSHGDCFPECMGFAQRGFYKYTQFPRRYLQPESKSKTHMVLLGLAVCIGRGGSGW